MGADVSINRCVAVMNDARGKAWYAAVEQTYDIKDGIRAARDSLVCFGSRQHCLDTVLRFQVPSTFGGMLQGDFTPASYLQDWLKAFRAPVGFDGEQMLEISKRSLDSIFDKDAQTISTTWERALAIIGKPEWVARIKAGEGIRFWMHNEPEVVAMLCGEGDLLGGARVGLWRVGAKARLLNQHASVLEPWPTPEDARPTLPAFTFWKLGHLNYMAVADSGDVLTGWPYNIRQKAFIRYIAPVVLRYGDDRGLMRVLVDATAPLEQRQWPEPALALTSASPKDAYLKKALEDVITRIGDRSAFSAFRPSDTGDAVHGLGELIEAGLVRPLLDQARAA